MKRDKSKLQTIVFGIWHSNETLNYYSYHFLFIMELFILIGGLYALYTVGMAIATELDYREVNRSRKDS